MHVSNLWQLCRDRETLHVCTMDQTCMLHEHIQTEDNCATFHLHVHANSTFIFSQIASSRCLCEGECTHVKNYSPFLGRDMLSRVWRSTTDCVKTRAKKNKAQLLNVVGFPKSQRCVSACPSPSNHIDLSKVHSLPKTPGDSKKQSFYHTSHSAPALRQHPPCWASHLGAVAFRRGTTIASVSHLNAWYLVPFIYDTIRWITIVTVSLTTGYW